MNELVSVIVPVYKVEQYLDRCIDSIVNQTYQRLEIILVDDGSPDSCGAMCEDWCKKDKRIRVVHKENQGLGYARNTGLDYATGDYVVFIDSDDFISHDYVEKLLTPMIESSADLVVGGFIRKYKSGKEISNPVVHEKKVVTQENIISDILLPVLGASEESQNDVEREMCVWRNMYKMDLIKKLMLRFVSEREYVSEDIFFNMRYFMNIRKACLIPDCIYYYWDNESSLTNTYREDRFEKYCKMLKTQIAILEEFGIYEVAKTRVYRTYLMKVRKCISLLAICSMSWRRKVENCTNILETKEFQDVLLQYMQLTNLRGKQKVFSSLMSKKRAELLLIIYYLLYHLRNIKRRF